MHQFMILSQPADNKRKGAPGTITAPSPFSQKGGRHSEMVPRFLVQSQKSIDNFPEFCGTMGKKPLKTTQIRIDTRSEYAIIRPKMSLSKNIYSLSHLRRELTQGIVHTVQDHLFACYRLKWLPYLPNPMEERDQALSPLNFLTINSPHPLIFSYPHVVQ